MTNNVCRLCLSIIQESIWVFDPNQNKLNDTVYVTTGVKISTTDNISQQICAQCCNIVKKFFIFKTKSLESDSLLKEKYALSNTDQPIIILDEASDDDSPNPLPAPTGETVSKVSEPAIKLHPSVVQMRKDYPNIKFPRLPANSHFLPFITLITGEVDKWLGSRNMSKAEIEQLKGESLKMVSVKEVVHGKESTTDKDASDKNLTKTTISNNNQTSKKQFRERGSKRLKLTHNLPMKNKENLTGEVEGSKRLSGDEKEFPPIPPIILKRVALTSDIYKAMPAKHAATVDKIAPRVRRNFYKIEVKSTNQKMLSENANTKKTKFRLHPFTGANGGRESYLMLGNQPFEASCASEGANVKFADAVMKENYPQVGDVTILSLTANDVPSNEFNLNRQETSHFPQGLSESGSKDGDGFKGYEDIKDAALLSPTLSNSSLLIQATKSQTIYTCAICNSVHDTWKGLQLHERKRHTKCPFCQIRFSSLAAKHQHVNNNCPKNCSTTHQVLGRVDKNKVLPPNVIRKAHDNSDTVLPPNMIIASSNDEAPDNTLRLSTTSLPAQDNISDCVEVSQSEPPNAVLNSRNDVVCISDGDEEKDEGEPKITISDNNYWNAINLREENDDIVKKLFDQMPRSEPTKNKNVVIEDCTADVTKISKNVRNYLYGYKIPLEIQHGRKLTFTTVTVQNHRL